MSPIEAAVLILCCIAPAVLILGVVAYLRERKPRYRVPQQRFTSNGWEKSIAP